jgi:hypothetical protein
VCVPKTSSVLTLERIIYHRSEMIALMCFCLRLFTLPFKSKIRLEAENAILRRQSIVLERKRRGRVRFTNNDRLFWTRRSHAQFNARDTSYRTRSLADCTINIPKSEFSVYATVNSWSSRSDAPPDQYTRIYAGPTSGVLSQLRAGRSPDTARSLAIFKREAMPEHSLQII